jgi:hypothetical protein
MYTNMTTPMLSGQGMGLSEEEVEQFKKSVLNTTTGAPCNAALWSSNKYAFLTRIEEL